MLALDQKQSVQRVSPCRAQPAVCGMTPTMRLKSDGDAIRGLGYVALYCARIEGAVDDLLQSLGRCGVALSPEISHRLTLQKIAFCLQAIQPHIASNQAMADLAIALKQADRGLEEASDAIHARTCGSFEGSHAHRSLRSESAPDRSPPRNSMRWRTMFATRSARSRSAICFVGHSRVIRRTCLEVTRIRLVALF